MVLNGALVVKVADVSVTVCQYIACNPERLSSDTVFHLLCCLPLLQLRRLGISLWTYLFFPPPSVSSSDGGDDPHRDHLHAD